MTDYMTSSSVLIDLAIFGRRLRAARILAGHETVAAAAAHITTCSGVQMSERTLGAMERGDQMPNIEQFLAITFCLLPPGGGSYWMPMLRGDIAESWVRELDEDAVRRGSPRTPFGSP